MEHYTLLGLEPGVDEKTITKAYRRLALKWHPDKNPKDRDDAARKFHALSLAYEALQDGATRSEVERQWAGKAEEKRRRGRYEAARREMVGDLEQREEQWSRGKRRQDEDEMRELQREVEKLKNEGLKMRRKYEEQYRTAAGVGTGMPAESTLRTDSTAPSGLDCTLQFRLSKAMTRKELNATLEPLASIDSIVINDRGTKGMVRLVNADAARQLMAKKNQEELRGIELAWAGEKDPSEKKRRFVFDQTSFAAPNPLSHSPSSLSALEDDVLTKMRNRQAAKRAGAARTTV